MISRAIQVSVLVRDQEEAKRFYTEKLGFTVCTDRELAPGWRYLTVAPHDRSETMIELLCASTPEQQALVGRQAADQALAMFASDDIESDYRRMKARGVVFHGEPASVPGGKGVGFEDLYGNQFDLYQIGG